MKRPSVRFIVLAFTLVTLNTIGLVWIHHDLTKVPVPVVRVLSATPEGDADKADCLSLVFDRQLAPKEAVGRTEEGELFELEPAWPGRWVWAAAERIEYRLDKRLPPGRTFHLRCTEKLTARTGRKVNGPSEFTFNTRPLRLQSCDIEAADRHKVTLQFRFNQPVEPAELLRHAKLFDGKDGKRIDDPVCLTKKPDAKLMLRAARPHSGKLRVVLAGELAGNDAELALGRPVTRNMDVTGGFTLLGARADQPGLDERITVHLRFSHELGGRQKLSNPSVKPAVEKIKSHRSQRNLVVTGLFDAGRQYTITVPGTLTDSNGHTLGTDRTVTVQIPDRDPRIRIPKYLGVLSPHGNLLLDAKVVNVGGMELSAFRVHENNLAAHLRGTNVSNTSRRMAKRTVKLDLPHNKPQKVALDLGGLLEGKRGIYRVNARATNSAWTSDWAIVSITDLAVTCKRQRAGLLVWVTSLRTAKPVPAARVRAITHNNQTLATAETNTDGLAQLRLPSDHPDGSVWVVTAEKGDDLSYLKPDEGQWVIDEVDQSGRPHPKTYEVMLYTERGVYRPGDTIRLTGIIRDGRGRIPPSFPIAVRVIRPDGRQVKELVAHPDPGGQGVFHTSFETSAKGQTGPYSFRVSLPESKEQLGQTCAHVEAFMPVRMEVRAQPTAERFGPTDTPALSVSGRYLWDQPAAELPVRVEGYLREAAFRSKRSPQFRFGTPLGRRSVTLKTISGQLDSSGKTRLDLKLPEKLKPALYRATVSGSVTEPGGRTVSGNTTLIVDRLGLHIGLHIPGGAVVPTDEDIEVRWVRLIGLDEPAEGGAMILRLLRLEHDTAVEKVNGRWVWRSTERTEEVATREIPPGDAAGSTAVKCPEAGQYRLVITDQQTGGKTQLDFYASAQGAGAQSLAMDRPERLEIVTDMETYRPGETAKVLVRSPLAGRMLLTLETDRVIESWVVKIHKNTRELLVPLPEDLRSGAFLTATVVRPLDPSRKSWLPHRAMGLARIRLNHDKQHMPVTIAAPRSAAPAEKVSFSVDVGPASDPGRPALLHVWAVDEGILLTAAYKTPDPGRFFLSSRSPGVTTSDLFGRLLPDHRRPTGMVRIGADEDKLGVSRLRRSPVPSRRRDAAVVWRTAVPVPPDGHVELQMQAPDLVGEMRLMAVTVDGDRYGCADHALTLTSPLIVEASWPRFVAPGDTFEAPVKFFNSTG